MNRSWVSPYGSRVVATRYAQALFGVVDAQDEAVAEELSVSQALQILRLLAF